MSRFSSRRSVLLGAILTAFAVSMPSAGAQEESAVEAGEQTLRPVRHSIAPGDRVSAAALAQAVAPRPVAVGDAELLRLKSEGSGDGGPAVIRVREIEAAPEFVRNRRALLKRRCNTNASSGLAPAGVGGAAGPVNLVVATNAVIGVYNATNCRVVGRESLADFFAGVGVPASATLHDPRVVFDRVSGRFFVTAVSRDSGNSDQYQYFAVSTNNVGTTYNLYRVTLSEGAARFCKRGVESVWDYPSAGYSRGRWYVTGNDVAANQRGAILSIDKAATLRGAPADITCFNRLAANLAPPIVIDRARIATFLSVGSGRSMGVVRIAVTEGAGGPKSDTAQALDNILIPQWTAAPAAAQPNGQRLDTLDGRFQSASIQAGQFIWNVHTVKVRNLAKVRLYRLPTADAARAPSLIFTPSTLTSENDNLFNASLAVRSANPAAPIFMSVTRTIPGDLNFGKPAHVIFEGPNNSADSARWGFAVAQSSPVQMVGCSQRPDGACRWADYSSTQIVPGNLLRGWGFNQIVAQRPSGQSRQTDWRTGAGLMEFRR